MVLYKLIGIKTLAPNERDPAVRALLPRAGIFPFEARFELHSDAAGRATAALANAIRRVLLGEFPCRVLEFDPADFSTNSPFTLFDFVLTRVRNIPLVQSCPDNAVFKLDYTNTSPVREDVRSAEIVQSGGDKHARPLFNETFTVCSAEPGAFVKATLRVARGRCHEDGGWFRVASNAVMKPIGARLFAGFAHQGVVGLGSDDGAAVAVGGAPKQKQANNGGEGALAADTSSEAAVDGISTSVSNFDAFELEYIGCGTISHADILLTAVDEIVRRLRAVPECIATAQFVNGVFILQIPRETATINVLLDTEILEQNPDIAAVVSREDHMTRTAVLHIRDPAADLKVRAAVAALVARFENLRAQIAKSK